MQDIVGRLLYSSYQHDSFVYSYGNNDEIGSVFFTHDKINNTIHITDLYIYRIHRGQGHGTNLIKQIIVFAQKNNVKTLTLDDMSSIQGQNNIYYKIGFRYIAQYEGPEMVMYLN